MEMQSFLSVCGGSLGAGLGGGGGEGLVADRNVGIRIPRNVKVRVADGAGIIVLFGVLSRIKFVSYLSARRNVMIGLAAPMTSVVRYKISPASSRG